MDESRSLVEGLLARVGGPMAFRMLLQPAIALVFGLRDGARDAREGRAPYFWALFTDAGHRREMVQSGWRSIGKVFVVAVALDLVFQFLAFHQIRPLGALMAGAILALLPYLLLRGPVNRLLRSRHEARKP